MTVAIGRGPLRVGPRGLARLRLTCPRTEASPPCRGAVTLRTRARVALGGRLRQVTLGRTTFRIGARRTVRLTLLLAPSRVALVRPRPAARQAIAVAIVRDAVGDRAIIRAPLRAGDAACVRRAQGASPIAAAAASSTGSRRGVTGGA